MQHFVNVIMKHCKKVIFHNFFLMKNDTFTVGINSKAKKWQCFHSHYIAFIQILIKSHIYYLSLLSIISKTGLFIS
jgi:hypothetical protein